MYLIKFPQGLAIYQDSSWYSPNPDLHIDLLRIGERFIPSGANPDNELAAVEYVCLLLEGTIVAQEPPKLQPLDYPSDAVF